MGNCLKKKYFCILGCGRKTSRKDDKCFDCIDTDSTFG